jgi:putative tryptophan/tyrosine transport system substrate-binding protein
MRRRDFITLVGGAAGTWPLAAHAQRTGTMRVLGVLMGPSENDPAAQSQLATFRHVLTKLGWMEGRNLRTELRWGGGDATKIGSLAKELVGLRPDVILGHTTRAIASLARETQTIPVVFPTVVDPVGSGFVASLSHPGANITGFQSYDPEIAGKWFELLKEIAPRTERVAALFNPATAVSVQQLFPSIQAAASSVGAQATLAPFHAIEELDTIFAEQARNPGAGLISLPDLSFLTSSENRALLVSLAARYRVPTIYWLQDFVTAGGLLAYAIDLTDLFRKAAGYVDRILKGEKPADLPIQRPTTYQLLINLKTATALGLNVPQTLLVSADKVIE